MKVNPQILFLLAVVSLTGAYLRPRRGVCIPPQGPPAAVCQDPCPSINNCPSTANCLGGVVTGVCDCDCPVCAKQKGQCCGGEKNYQGKCDVGLRCHSSYIGVPPVGPGGFVNKPHGHAFPNIGVCAKI